MPRVKGGFCGCHNEYIGPDPVSNYAKLVAIDIIKGVFATVIAGAGTIATTVGAWYLKEKIGRKMGWIKDNSNPVMSGTERRVGVQEDTASTVEHDEPNMTIRSLNEDIKVAQSHRPMPLGSDLIQMSDVILVFAGAGAGKTIFSNQVALGISSGQPTGLFPDESPSVPQPVLLIDAEQREEDIYQRFGNMEDRVPANFTRISNCFFNSPEEVVDTIDQEVSMWNEDGTVVIDNLTSLFSIQSAEKIRAFYAGLHNLQIKHKERGFKLTLVIVCHEAKSATKLTLKSIQGSGNIGNFATKVFALGHSTLGEDMRYLKVLKSRRSPKNGNVLLMKIVEEPYLHFEFQGEISEEEATRKSNDNQEEVPVYDSYTQTSGDRKLTDEQIQEIKSLFAKGESVYSLHKRFKVNRNTIQKYLDLD